jgi:predicted transcriptional regulator of viral defense system
VAVMSLVRLMNSRHNQMLVQVREQLTKQLRKKKKTKKKKKKTKTDDQPTQEDRGAA